MYKKINSFDEIDLSIINKNTLVVLDIDETMLKYKNINQEWWMTKINEYKNIIMNKTNNIIFHNFVDHVKSLHNIFVEYEHLIEHLLVALQKKDRTCDYDLDIKLLENKLECCETVIDIINRIENTLEGYVNNIAHMEWLEYIKKNNPLCTDIEGVTKLFTHISNVNATTIYLTARPSHMHEITIEHLTHVKCPLKPIYFTNRELKGPILKNIVDNININIKNIVVVDDSIKHLDSICDEMKKRNIITDAYNFDML